MSNQTNVYLINCHVEKQKKEKLRKQRNRELMSSRIGDDIEPNECINSNEES